MLAVLSPMPRTHGKSRAWLLCECNPRDGEGLEGRQADPWGSSLDTQPNRVCEHQPVRDPVSKKQGGQFLRMVTPSFPLSSTHPHAPPPHTKGIYKGLSSDSQFSCLDHQQRYSQHADQTSGLGFGTSVGEGWRI